MPENGRISGIALDRLLKDDGMIRRAKNIAGGMGNARAV